MVLYIGKVRKDGKIPATYVFEYGRRINKILSPEKLQEERVSGIKIIGSSTAGRMKAW